MELHSQRPLAVVTGGSSGIGRELARLCVAHAYDVVLIADGQGVHEVAGQLGADVASVYSQRHDLSSYEGVEEAWKEMVALGRPVDVLMLNAGVGVVGDFATESDLEAELRMVRLNCDGVVHLAKRVLPGMIARGSGRVLVTSSVAASMPAALSAVYGATKAFDLSFAEALREELEGTGVTVTVVQPGPTETNFFHREGADQTRVGRAKKDHPALVARQAFDAMLRGKHKVYAGSLKNRLLAFFSKLLPEPTKARMHRRLLQHV